MLINSFYYCHCLLLLSLHYRCRCGGRKRQGERVSESESENERVCEKVKKKSPTDLNQNKTKQKQIHFKAKRYKEVQMTSFSILHRLPDDLLMSIVEFFGLNLKNWAVLSAVDRKFHLACRSEECLLRLKLGKSVKDKTVRALSGAGLEKLTRLDLKDNIHVSNEAVLDLLLLPHLTEIDLSGSTEVTDEGFSALSRMTGLKTLKLRSTHLLDDGLRALSDLKNLEVLHLGCTWITDSGTPALLSLKSLVDLDFSGCPHLTAASLAFIPPSVRTLNLQCCSNMFQAGLSPQISKLPLDLTTLHLESSCVTKDALRSLAPALSELKDLFMCGPRTMAENQFLFQEIAACFPSLKVHWGPCSLPIMYPRSRISLFDLMEPDERVPFRRICNLDFTRPVERQRRNHRIDDESNLLQTTNNTILRDLCTYAILCIGANGNRGLRKLRSSDIFNDA